MHLATFLSEFSFRVHRCLPELGRVHLSEYFIALYVKAFLCSRKDKLQLLLS